MDLSRCRIPLRDQVVACLLILRQNLPQMVVADLLGVSQPTISRIWRRITVLLEAALLSLPGGLTEAIQQGHLILIDGTHAPYREPPSQRATATTTPGNAISSASMSRSPPPTAVTSSLSLTRFRDPDTTRRPSTCAVGKTSSTPPAPPGSPTPPTSPPPPSPRSRSYPTSPAPNTTKTSTLPSPESASTSNTASHN